MSLPLEIEQAFVDLHRQVVNNHKGIRRSLSRLRTLVVGHYQDAKKEREGLEIRVVELEGARRDHERRIGDLEARV